MLYKTIIINNIREVSATKVFIAQKFYASILSPACKNISLQNLARDSTFSNSSVLIIT